MNLQPIDMDELDAQAKEMDHVVMDGDNEDKKEPEDRGDEVSTTDDKKGEKYDKEALEELANGDEEGDDDEDAGEEEQETDNRIPRSRLNEVIAQRNATTEIAELVLDGELPAEMVKELGGAKSLAHGVAKGEFTVDDLKAYAAHEWQKDQGGGGDQGGDEEGTFTDLDDVIGKKVDLLAELADAVADEDDKRQDDLKKQIREVEKEIQLAIARGSTSRAAVDPEEISAKAAEQALARIQEEREARAVEEATPLAVQMIEAHSVLEENEAVFRAFTSVVNEFRNDGLAPSDALLQAEKVFFPDSATVSAKLSGKKQSREGERMKTAIENAADLLRSQPPDHTRAGSRIDSKRVEEMTEEEFDNLSQREKARLRGDFVE